MATNKKEPYLKLGQIWRIPIITGFYADGRVEVLEEAHGFYYLKEKNTNGMWKCLRIYVTPEGIEPERDQFHNRFMHSSRITQNGELVGKGTEIPPALKILYGSK